MSPYQKSNPLLLISTEQEIVLFIAYHENATYEKMMTEMGVPRSTICTKMQWLLGREVVEAWKEGRIYHFRLTEKGRHLAEAIDGMRRALDDVVVLLNARKSTKALMNEEKKLRRVVAQRLALEEKRK